MKAATVAPAGISRREIEALIVRTDTPDRTDAAFFDDAKTAKGAVDVLIGTVRTAAKGCGVATVVSLGCRVLKAITALGGDALEKLRALLTSAACHACNKAVQLEWKPITGLSGPAYELRVTDHACT